MYVIKFTMEYAEPMRSAEVRTGVYKIGSAPFSILLAKSEIHAMHVWQAVENPVCLRAGPCDNDFASSIVFGEAD
jgi:hypothetical protein